MAEVSTSILNLMEKPLKEEELIRILYDIEISRTDYFHIDVMDGEFVPKNTSQFMLKTTSVINEISTVPVDVHLMVKNVKEYVDEYLAYEPNIITFHLEAMKDRNDTVEMIKYIKKNNCKVGISIKPNTDLNEVLDFLPYVHMVLIMTVEPGEGRQGFIAQTLEKVKELKKYLDQNQLSIDIEVDGGINSDTVNIAKEAGANMLVVGTAIINAENRREVINKLKA